MTFAPALVRRGYALGESGRRAHAFGHGATLVIGISVAVAAANCPHMSSCSETKEDIARATVTKYALEAFPSWQETHPAMACPSDLLVLNEWMNNKDIRDPWGTDYRFRCRSVSGVGHLTVRSAGTDQEHGTADDIASDR